MGLFCMSAEQQKMTHPNGHVVSLKLLHMPCGFSHDVFNQSFKHINLRAAAVGSTSQIPVVLPLTFTMGSKSLKMFPVPSTSCHLCTCNV